MRNMKEIMSNELEELKSQGKKILAEFYADWCVPCKQLMPRLEAMSSEFTNIEFVKLNVDKNMDFAMALGIKGVPTVIVYDGSEEKTRSSGANPDSFYRQTLNKM